MVISKNRLGTFFSILSGAKIIKFLIQSSQNIEALMKFNEITEQLVEFD